MAATGANLRKAVIAWVQDRSQGNFTNGHERYFVKARYWEIRLGLTREAIGTDEVTVATHMRRRDLDPHASHPDRRE